jgi:hypothetical protein
MRQGGDGVGEYLYTNETLEGLLVGAFTLNEDAPVDSEQFRAVAMLLHTVRDRYERQVQELVQENTRLRELLEDALENLDVRMGLDGWGGEVR